MGYQGTHTEGPMKTVARTFEIIDTLRELNGAGVTELSEELDIPNSTIHDYLKALAEQEFLVQRNGRYEVTLKFLDYGGAVRKEMDIYPAGWPEVQDLALETGEHANLMIEEFGRGRYIYIAEGEDSAKLDTYTGMEIDLHTAALGKAILAHFPEERVKEIVNSRGLSTRTPNTIVEKKSLFEELQKIRDRGYATDDEERAVGVRCIASPIRGQQGEIYGSVGVSGPTSRLQGERFESELPGIVQRTANLIELSIANA